LDELINPLQAITILPDFDVSVIHNFLASDYMDIEKDEIFLNKLQGHLGNIGKYKITVQQILLYKANSTTESDGRAAMLNGRLGEFVVVCKKDSQSCISEIEKLIEK